MGYFDSKAFEPEPSTYPIVVADASAFVGKSGDEFGKLVLEVREGEHKGQTFDHWLRLSHDVGKRIAMEALVGYGLDIDEIESFEDLAERIGDLIGVQADVTVSPPNARGFSDLHVFRQLTLQSDVPGDTSDFDAPKTDQRSFAQATGNNDDKIPF